MEKFKKYSTIWVAGYVASPNILLQYGTVLLNVHKPQLMATYAHVVGFVHPDLNTANLDVHSNGSDGVAVAKLPNCN